MPNIYAIGDVHGQYDLAVNLIADLYEDGMNFDNGDMLIQLGDLIDGGPQTSQVIGLFMEMQLSWPDNVIVLKGNHEQLMIDALPLASYRPEYQLWWQQGGYATATSYLRTGHQALHPQDIIPMSDVRWLDTRPLFYETQDYIFVHAGLRPPLDNPRSNNAMDMLWIREEFYLSSYDWPKTIVFGHTAFEKPFVRPKLIGIDTMHHGSGTLTAVKLPEMKFFQHTGA